MSLYEWKNERDFGRTQMKDLILCHIIGFQNDIGDTNNDGYKSLQKLYEFLTDTYGEDGTLKGF